MMAPWSLKYQLRFILATLSYSGQGFGGRCVCLCILFLCIPATSSARKLKANEYFAKSKQDISNTCRWHGHTLTTKRVEGDARVEQCLEQSAALGGVSGSRSRRTEATARERALLGQVAELEREEVEGQARLRKVEAGYQGQQHKGGYQHLEQVAILMREEVESQEGLHEVDTGKRGQQQGCERLREQVAVLACEEVEGPVVFTKSKPENGGNNNWWSSFPNKSQYPSVRKSKASNYFTKSKQEIIGATAPRTIARRPWADRAPGVATWSLPDHGRRHSDADGESTPE